jgi:hypothetical protein
LNQSLIVHSFQFVVQDVQSKLTHAVAIDLGFGDIEIQLIQSHQENSLVVGLNFTAQALEDVHHSVGQSHSFRLSTSRLSFVDSHESTSQFIFSSHHSTLVKYESQSHFRESNSTRARYFHQDQLNHVLGHILNQFHKKSKPHDDDDSELFVFSEIYLLSDKTVHLSVSIRYQSPVLSILLIITLAGFLSFQ